MQLAVKQGAQRAQPGSGFSTRHDIDERTPHSEALV